MKVVEFEQPEKMMELYFVGDTHYPRGIRSKFLEVLKEIENNPHAYAIGMGDFCENITAGDPRYNPEEIANIVMKHGQPLNMVDEQWKMFENDIKPLAEKGRVLGLLMGNHGSSFARRNSYNSLKGICERNGIMYLGDGMAVFDISYKGKHTFIQVFHGSGGGTTVGFAYKRLSDYSNIISDVDVVAAGHSHKLGINISILPLKLENGVLKQKIQYHCSTGSFLGNYEENTTSYAERKAYPPLPIGYVRLEIYKGKVVPDSVVPVPV